MKKLLISLSFVLLGICHAKADITIKAKVPDEWINTIYVQLYDHGNNNDLIGRFETTTAGEWHTYTYSGSATNLRAIWVSHTENGTSKWPDRNMQTTNVDDITSDKCIEITHNQTSSSKSTWANTDCPSGGTEQGGFDDPETPTSYTFPAGTTIYYDLREYGAGINIYNGKWYADVSSIISVTLTADWEVTSETNLFKSAANSWNYKTCSTLPTEGQNMIVSSDGINYSWDTYVPPITPTVAFISLGNTIQLNEDVMFAATSNNINGAGVPASSYKFYVKKGSGGYSLISSGHYQFTETGTYTIRVRALDSSDISKAEMEQTIEVIDGNVLYYIKTNDWAQVNAHMWGTDPSTTWPGLEMTLTATTTARNNYPVYSVAFVPEYNKVIFSNDGASQSSNLDINAATPYFFNGEWYASLAECDQPVLTTDFYLAGSFNGWSTTANRFMKEAEEDAEASVIITISEYSDISFKIIESGGWCGSTDAITHDADTATIAAKGVGDNISMTPFAAGEYVFTLNLDSRLLTVTYPDGDQMPIPTNIFLACDVLNEWSENDEDYKFTVDGDLATLAVNLEAETAYAFKLVYNSAWFGANYNFNYYWNTDVTMVKGATQANLYTFKAGTYTFRYKLSTSELSIDYPATSATNIAVSSFGYATLYSATAYDVPNDAEAYIITGTEGIRLNMERIYRVPAYTGVIIVAPEGEYAFYEGDGRFMDAIGTNYLKGSISEELIDNGSVHYVLSYNEEGKVGMFWPYGTGANGGVGAFTNGAGKAYMELPTQSAAAAARRGYLFFEQEEVATPTDAIETSSAHGKFIRNGQLLIFHNNRIYDAHGMRVQ